MISQFKFRAIGTVRSCFKEKFGVPRQAGLARSAEATIEIVPPYAQAEAFREIEQFSHIWIIFVFDQCIDKEWRPTVRPPRMGGNTRVGVFASRSPFRPNPIGMSAVELLETSTDGEKFVLRVAGIDLVDGTPVLDIKPYLPYADRLSATDGYATQPTATMKVRISESASTQIRDWEVKSGQSLLPVIREILELDPRPAYREDDSSSHYGVRLFDFNLKFEVQGDQVVVTGLEKVDD